MQQLPHHYSVSATADTDTNVALTSAGLAQIDSAPPAEFGGPGDLWSPESLLVASVADCFILSFRAIARASKLDWISLRCDVEGVLDRVDNLNQFISFTESVVLEVSAGTDEKKAMRILEKAETACLITNSLKAETHLKAEVLLAS